ncbi:MAG: hypothetical protein IPG71_05025 [bacterium]|nr:hypothetical protein [bacterium]
MITLRIAFLLALASIATAIELPCKVQYVSANSVYLSDGRASGIVPGDSVILSRGASELARAIIAFLSENSSSCEIADAAKRISKHDDAVVFTTAEPKPQSAPPTSAQLDTLVETPGPQSLTKRAPGERPNQLSGRISFDYTMQDDREPANYDYTQPGLSARAVLKRINGSDFSARTNLRLRRTVRANDDLSASTNRIYEAMLAYEPESNPLTAGVGRLNLRETRGMGYFDGAYAKYDASQTIAVGLIGGFEPDPENTRIQTDRTKLGTFISYRNAVGVSQYMQATASLAGRYLDGEISREFLYQQFSFTRGSRLRLFESAELNLNRAWLKDAEGSSLTVASLLFDAHYSFSRALAISAAYDNRQPYYTAETRALPDSVFDRALQQGFRAGLETRFAESYSADIGLGARGGAAQESQATSAWLRVGSSDLANTRLRAFARVRWFDSDLSSGLQPSLSLSREFAKGLDAGIEVGQNSYELVDVSDRISQQWVALLLDIVPARHTYLAAEFEQGFGDGRDVALLRLALGYRF